MIQELKELLRQTFSKEKIKKFIYHKIMLVVALICEILALLIRNGKIQADPQLVGSLTWAGIIIMLIWLLMDGLKSKYYRYGRKWGFLDEEGNPIEQKPEDEPCEDEQEETTP